MEVEEVGSMEEVSTSNTTNTPANLESELEMAVEGATGGAPEEEEKEEEPPIIISDKPQPWHSAVPQVNKFKSTASIMACVPLVV